MYATTRTRRRSRWWCKVFCYYYVRIPVPYDIVLYYSVRRFATRATTAAVVTPCYDASPSSSRWYTYTCIRTHRTSRVYDGRGQNYLSAEWNLRPRSVPNCVYEQWPKTKRPRKNVILYYRGKTIDASTAQCHEISRVDWYCYSNGRLNREFMYVVERGTASALVAYTYDSTRRFRRKKTIYNVRNRNVYETYYNISTYYNYVIWYSANDLACGSSDIFFSLFVFLFCSRHVFIFNRWPVTRDRFKWRLLLNRSTV